jgi:DNA-binding transcriptional LysR family regulator
MRAMLAEKKADLVPAALPFSLDPELKKISRTLFTTKDAVGISQFSIWAADVLTPARPHMLLLVPLAEGRFLADVGYGRLTLNEPLRLEPDVEQPTTHCVYRLVCSSDEFQLQTLLGGTWRALYQLSLQEQTPAELEVASRYTSTHPDSIFTKSLAFRSRGLEPPQESVTADIHLRIHLLTTGRFLTVLPADLLQFVGKRWSLKTLPIDLGIQAPSLGVLTLRNRTLSPVAQLFIDCTREVAKSMAAAWNPARARKP